MSSSQDIPADVMAIAEDHVPKGIEMRGSIVWYVARAILAERERCAGLVKAVKHMDSFDRAELIEAIEAP